MSSLLEFNRVYRLEIQSLMLVFSTPLMKCCPSTFFLTSPPLPPSQSIRTAVGGGVGGVKDHILQEFNTLFLTRFRTYQSATPPQTKTPVKTTFRGWCLYSSFVHGLKDGCMYQEKIVEAFEDELGFWPPNCQREHCLLIKGY
jgi:hypothetical protein